MYNVYVNTSLRETASAYLTYAQRIIAQRGDLWTGENS